MGGGRGTKEEPVLEGALLAFGPGGESGGVHQICRVVLDVCSRE